MRSPHPPVPDTDAGPARQTLSPFSERVVRNTLFNLCGRFGQAVAPIVLTPYTIHVLGLPLFGVWVLISSVVSYLSLGDFGVAAGLSRCAAREQAAANVTGLNRLLVAGILYYALVGVVTVLSAWLLAGPLVGLMGVPGEMQQQARWLLIAGAVVLAYGQVLSVGESLLVGMQFMDVSSGISLVGTVLDIAATVAVLTLGYGLAGLLIKDGFLTVVLGLLRLAMLARVQPGMAFRLRLANRATLQELLSYGLRIQITRLAELTITHVDKLLLGHFAGLQTVAQFEVAARVVRLVKYLVLTITSALMPAATALQTLGHDGRLLSLYYRSSRYLILVAAPASLFLVAAAPNLLLAWVGPGYGQAVLFLQALAIGHFVHTLTSAGTTIVRGVGRPDYETRYTLLLLVGDTLLGVALIGRFGYAGAIVATPLALIAASVYFFAIFHRLFGASFRHLLRVYTQPCATAAALALPLWLALAGGYARWGGLDAAADTGRWPMLALLLLCCACYGVAYAVILWRRGYLDELDITLIRRYLPLWMRRDRAEAGPWGSR
jgi:O-antigen/teichoic acid export membrane protein